MAKRTVGHSDFSVSQLGHRRLPASPIKVSIPMALPPAMKWLGFLRITPLLFTRPYAAMLRRARSGKSRAAHGLKSIQEGITSTVFERRHRDWALSTTSFHPSAIGEMPVLWQVHSSRYCNPAQLPPGAVLVVGSGNSGCQITEDLLRSGRHVYLAVGAHRRAPRRYRGRDCTWWQFALGEFDQTKKPERRMARLLTGVDGGHDMDLRQLARDGATLLGHLRSARDGEIELAADLRDLLVQGDAWFNSFLDFRRRLCATERTCSSIRKPAARAAPRPERGI